MIKSKQFRNRITGEIATQIPILDIANWEGVEEQDSGWVYCLCCKHRFLADVSKKSLQCPNCKTNIERI